MSQALFGPIVQIGYVVGDLDAAVAARIAGLGLGPWTIFRGSELNGHYRGEATTVTMDVALGYQDGMQIELIQQRGVDGSPYVGANGPKIGVHHIAWLVEDLDVALAAAKERGMLPVFTAGNAAVRVAYLSAAGEPDVLYELIEGADMRGMIDAGIAATAAWDGSNPIIEIDMAVTADNNGAGAV
jgi:methylmalonyl-CoA/ethylmalonyl-CoA epimerase